MASPDTGGEVSREFSSLLMVAGGVLASVSLIIQLVDSVEGLRGYWSSFKDAPWQVETIVQDLEHLKNLLKDRATSLPAPSKVLLSVINRCHSKIVPLERIVEELEPGFKSRHRIIRIWSAHRSTKKAAQIQKFQDALLDAKLDIILANQQVSEQFQHNQFATLNDVISTFTVHASSSMAMTASWDASKEEKLTRIEEQMAELKAHMLDLKGLFPFWVDGLRSLQASRAMNALVQRITQNVLDTEEMKDIIQKLVESELDPGSSAQAAAETNDVHQQDAKPTSENQEKRRSESGAAKQYCENEYSTKYKTFLGTVYYKARVLRTVSGNHPYAAEAVQRELSTSWTIVPSLWLLGTGLNFLVAKSTQGWKQQIQYFPVVRNDSLMFQYCIEGNANGVRQLLDEKVASPNTCDEHGFTALHRAASLRHVDVCLLLIQNGANANSASFSTGETPLHQLPVNRSRAKSADLLETVRVLVNHGHADPMVENANGQNACQVFENFFKWPSRIALRKQMAKCLTWLKSEADEPTVKKPVEGMLFNNIDIDHEVESLDLILKPGSDLEKAFGPQKCPGSYMRGWTVLHVLMHLRIEPVWHPSSVDDILQQKPLWTGAMARILKQGFETHAVDWEGNTPSSLAMRSLFTFHVWQNALAAENKIGSEFVHQELAVCTVLAHDGWSFESLQLLFLAPAEDLYLHHAEWRERPKMFKFKNRQYNGLYIQCCWFQLLDVLKHRNILPRGWQVLTAARQFYRPRECFYWHASTGTLQKDRPIGGSELDIEYLNDCVAQGEKLVDGLGKLGVVWQG